MPWCLGQTRNPTTCYLTSHWSPSGTWRWVRRLDQSKNCVHVPPLNCTTFFPINTYCLIRDNFTELCRKDFTAYAEICFREFSDRVSHWTTLNEANVFVLGGYDLGILPPQRCSATATLPFNCSKGNSSTEPYMATHNILLAHAAVARLYKKKYQVRT